MKRGLNYYNEIDPQAAAWLRNLIVEGVIAPGDVDERDVRDVKPVELFGYTQCHFFAGIGVWSYALRLAGWPDDRPVWTGSCPCQPFSAAGKGAGFADERHLWPYWHHHIRCGRPDVVFGEQVSNGHGVTWIDLVHDDMEGEAYTMRPLDSCSAGVGAPHLRQRLWFMAYPESVSGRARLRDLRSRSFGRSQFGHSGDAIELALSDSVRPHRTPRLAAKQSRDRKNKRIPVGNRSTGFVDHAISARLEGHARYEDGAARWEESFGHAATAGQPHPLGDDARGGFSELRHALVAGQGGHAHSPSLVTRPGPTNAFWRAADWLRCRDERWRPVEPGTFPLAHGVAGRVGLLRGYGNAINPWNAAALIDAGMYELEEAA